MKYTKFILTVIAILLLIITCKLMKNPVNVNIDKIGGRYIEIAEPIRIIDIDR